MGKGEFTCFFVGTLVSFGIELDLGSGVYLLSLVDVISGLISLVSNLSTTISGFKSFLSGVSMLKRCN